MIEIKTLEKQTFNEVEEVFNLAFSDYFFSIRFTAEQLKQKFDREAGNLQLSIGAFDNGKLVGFILHFLVEKEGRNVLYNGGTGVIPSHRGQGLTKKMWTFIQPKLQKYKVKKSILEVLTINDPAINVYKSLGYTKLRTLNCFKGVLAGSTVNYKYDIRKLDNIDWILLSSFWDYHPTWQNSIMTMKNSDESIAILGVYDKSSLIGYGIFNSSDNRLHQLAVSKPYRRKGVASFLLSEIAQLTTKPISFINLDTRIPGIKELLEKFNLSVFTQQYEMETVLN